MIYLSYDQVVEIHDDLIVEFGGLAGIREIALLESSLAAPMMSVYNVERHRTVFDKASAYLFSLARNHPFIDGNKRTASAVALIFLRLNNESPEYNADEFVSYVCKVAEGKYTPIQISRELKKMCIKT